ncbi:hypothetical protein V2E39_09220 [Chryseobacterium arthrosphaerae]|uniref:Uncharacterized protein n=1 Tax=Chryseobacterium arthrosphaerae TaxID=651561 RepID=A0ABU7QYC5_9FLAO|nr:hypothetical protein [Chryseobacterium arthrosphaerae]
MHTTDTIKRYKIFSAEDVQKILPGEYSSIEVYAKNMTFAFTEIDGNLILRGEGCRFPDLVSISGNLSIDAGNCELPRLKTIGGSFAMHGPAVLDKLEKVKGDFKCIINFGFKNTIKIDGSIELKNATVYTGNKKLSAVRRTIAVNHQYQVDFLPKDGVFNVDVFADDIVFQHQKIQGRISLYGENISFPNLECIQGRFKIEPRKKKDPDFEHDFPVLKKMTGNLIIDKTKVCFPELKELTGNIEIRNNSFVKFPLLEKSGSILIRQHAGAEFPVLRVVNGCLQNHGFETCYLTELQIVTGSFFTHQILAKNILEVGNLMMSRYCEFDHLKKINGFVDSNMSFNYQSLEYIGYMMKDQQKSSKLPSLKRIGHYLYNKNDGFENLADRIYFKVKDNMYITKDKCYISRILSNQLYQHFGHPLEKLVSILKLRHTSFQNFITREYEREWNNYDSPNFVKVLNNIEKIWDNVEPITYEEFFTHYDTDFRLFCFSYFGVGTLMKKLEAKKINQEKILVNYFQYDKDGNKIAVRRTNYYEVYEVENTKFRHSFRMRELYSYAVKCWCPSTAEEHWLWIESRYKNNALTAIASTFRIHENIIPHIKCLKRQGDLLICEMEKKVVPKGAVRPLTADEYFSLLEAES